MRADSSMRPDVVDRPEASDTGAIELTQKQTVMPFLGADFGSCVVTMLNRPRRRACDVTCDRMVETARVTASSAGIGAAGSARCLRLGAGEAAGRCGS